MKTTIIFGILIGLLFSGCEPPVLFNEPQPADTKSLSEFPGKLQGEYLSTEGNALLKIDNRLILCIYDYDQKAHKNQLDSTIKITGDTLFNLSDSSKTFVRFEGDSLVAHYHSEDTLFYISNQNVLKKFKGYYFLNFGDTTHWYVNKLFLSKGILSINTISTKDEINNLREITETTSDTTSYNFKPTKKQFKEFIRQDGFKDSAHYVRLKR